MDDEVFEQHRAALEEEGIVVEAKITARGDSANEEVKISLVVQSDDGKKVGPNEIRVGHDYQVVFFYKGLHPPKPKKPKQRRAIGSSDTTSEATGATSAPDGDSARTLQQEIDAAAEAHKKKIAHKYSMICHGWRNEPRFRGFLFDLRKVPILRNPVEAIKWVKEEQHKILGVDSCAHIYPGSHAEKMFEWLDAAYEADKNNRPIPAPPEAPRSEKV